MKLGPIACAVLALAGCARATAIPVAKNMVSITTDAAPACGATGAQTVAGKQAAIETIRRGFDSYVISSGQHDSTLNVYGRSASTSHHQALTVVMFHNGQPGSENALDARQTLGPDWKRIASEDTITCF